MDHLRRGNKELIKDINRTLVLDQIRTKGPLSRTDIAKNTKLGLSTVTKIVDSLAAQRLVREVGEGDSSGGRRPIYVGFNHDYGYVVGVKIERQQVILAVTDLRPAVRIKRTIPFKAGAGADEVLALIVNGLSGFRKEKALAGLPCLGIGIGVSGLVNKESGELLHSSLLGWDRIDFRRYLSRHCEAPIFVDNDVNVYTLAELWYGYGREFRNFAVVTVGAGVGAGLVQNGQLFRGEYGGAGEIGHTVLFPGGNDCLCGQKGCLETYVDDDFVVAEAARLSARNAKSVLRERRGGLGMADILAAAQAGDECAAQALAAAGRNLGVGLVNLVNLLNPGAVILAGEGMSAKQYIVPAAESVLKRNFFAPHQPPVRLLVSTLGDDAWVIGAAAMVLYELFQAPIYRKSLDVKLI